MRRRRAIEPRRRQRWRCGPSAINVVPAALGCQEINLAVGATTLFWTDRGHGAVTSQPVSSPRKTAELSTTRRTTQFAPCRSPEPAFDVAREDKGYPTALARDGSLIAFSVDLEGAVDVVTVSPGVVASCGETAPADQASLADQLHAPRAAAPSRSRMGSSSEATASTGQSTTTSRLPGRPTGGTLAIDGSTTQPIYSVSDIDIATTVGGSDVTALAGGPDDLYFGEDGLFEKAPYVQGSQAIVMARGQKAPGSIAIGATTVFWSAPARVPPAS